MNAADEEVASAERDGIRYLHRCSPLPWGKNVNGDFPIYAGESPNHTHVCQPIADNFETRKADAAYIVQACNSFPDLVEALKYFLDVCDKSPPVDLIENIGRSAFKARAALKKAGAL